MNVFLNFHRHGLVVLLGAFCCTLSMLVYAQAIQTAPGPISGVPLATQGGAKPNLLIFIDSSGSMNKELGSGETRIEVVKQAATSLIDSLDDESMRVGLAQFDNDDGALILQNLSLLTPAAKASVKAKISGIDAGGFTPLAEAASGIGRYFTFGYPTSGRLTLHPENSFGKLADSTHSVGQIFINGPAFATGQSAPSQTIEFHCQKNFFMVLTDGLPTRDQNVSTLLQDYDNDDSDNCGTETGCPQYPDDGSDFLDDVTTAMFDMDLRPDLDGPDRSNPAKNNVSTYMVGFAEGALANNPLMESAANQAGGQFLFATDSTGLQNAFRSILTDIFSRVGASSAVAFNATSLNAGAIAYLASYNSDKWSGNLVARTIDSDGNISDAELWDAESELPVPRARFILTSESGSGKLFANNLIGGLSISPQEADLQIDTATATVDNRAGERLDYIRGSSAGEGDAANTFRRRDGAIGDIVNSTPIYVGEPDFDYPDSPPFGTASDLYSEFVADNVNRKAMVYVGANDGMLHGFDALTGEEKIAYVPELVLSTKNSSGLHYLSSQEYAHKFYVDLSPTVADVFFNNAWHTVLAGGLGAGGKGYFFLDITDPDDFSADNAKTIVLGELGVDDDDMGLSFSQPKIALLNNGRWAAIFGNGYNSNNGVAVLYIYYFDNGDVKKITTGAGDATDKNGLSTPSLADLNGDGVVDWVYAGDVQGNMWAFDLCNIIDGVCEDVSTNWGKAYPDPLFRTDMGSDSLREPITTAPRLASNTAVPAGAFPNILVMFGSGQYLNTEDLQDTDGSSYYAVWDRGDFGLDSSDLALRRLGISNGLRTISGEPVDWSTQYGWQILLADGSAGTSETIGGERVIVDSLLMSSVLFFNTAIPSTETCSSGGTGWLMSVDFATGLAPAVAVFDANNDGVIDAADEGFVGELPVDLDDGSGASNGGANGGLPSAPVIIAGGGGIGSQGRFCLNVNGNLLCGNRNWYAGDRVGRLSWHEVTPF